MTMAASDNFVTEKNKRENEPIWLYEVIDIDGNGTNKYFAENNEDVIYPSSTGGITYKAFPIKHNSISEGSQGEVDQVKVTFGNATREFQGYIEAYDIRGVQVNIKLVWANKLDDEDNFVQFTYYVDSFTGNEEAVEVTLSTKMNVMDVTLPKRIYLRGSCRWKFKGEECLYSGVETSCDKTKERCKALNNYLRFGGFPAIPTRGVFTR
jgi:lambda family phage minor tail protein L